MTTEASATRRGRTETRAADITADHCANACGRIAVHGTRWCRACMMDACPSLATKSSDHLIVAMERKALADEFADLGVTFEHRRRGGWFARVPVDLLRRLVGGRG